MEEIDGYNVELNKAYTKMVSGIIDFSTATKDAPVDATSLIINPGSRRRLLMKTRSNGKMSLLRRVGRPQVEMPQAVSTMRYTMTVARFTKCFTTCLPVIIV